MRTMIVNRIKSYISKELKRRKWRKLNQHNFTSLGNRMNFAFDKVIIGSNTYGEINVLDFGDYAKLSIGDYCSIAQEVTFILNAEHVFTYLSSYPFKVKIVKSVAQEATSKGDILIDDDVWIGYRSTILSGVHIGQGAVIAANSTVVKSVPPYAIVGGNPAKIIRYRFPKDIIDVLLNFDFKELTKEKAESKIDNLYKEIDSVEDAKHIIDILTKPEEE